MTNGEMAVQAIVEAVLLELHRSDVEITDAAIAAGLRRKAETARKAGQLIGSPDWERLGDGIDAMAASLETSVIPE